MVKSKKGLYYVFAFFSVSIIAWFFEMIFSLVVRSKFVLPGVLTGPWCPIYGLACLILFLVAEKEEYMMLSFIKVFLVSAVVEYYVAYLSELVFHHKIWNYVNYFMNIKGRICLSMTILFTIGGLIWIHVAEPILYKKFLKNKKIYSYASIICLILIIIDYAYSFITKW